MVDFLISGSAPAYLNSNNRLVKCFFNAFQKIEQSSYLVEFEKLPKLLIDIKPKYLIMFGTFAHNSLYYEDIVYSFRKNCKGKIIWWTHDDPYEIDTIEKIINFGDFYITNDKSSLMFYSQRYPSFHIPLAACSECFYETIRIKNNRINFIGNAHIERIDLFSKLNINNLDIFGTNWPDSITVRLNQMVNATFAKKIFNTYAGSIDIQRTSSIFNEYFQVNSSTPGPRLFEMALAGANIYLHSNSLEFLEYFNSEDLTWGNKLDDLLEFISKSSSDRKWALKNSTNIQKQALEKHTFYNRAKKLLNFLI